MTCPDPRRLQPPLTVGDHAWRLLAMLVISLVVWLDVREVELEIGDWFVAMDAGLGLAAYVVVHFRRRHPVAAAIVTSLLSTVSGIAAAPALLALVSLATRRRGREIGPVASLSFGCAQLFSTITAPPDFTWYETWFTLGVNMVGTWAAVGWGLYLGSRRELVWTLRQRAETAEAERDLRVTQARTGERTRIAREMHDVLAHRISQISLHAGALTFREDLSPDEMRASVAVIQDKAHEALTDLRNVLGVLRDDDGAPLTRPQPTYDDLPALVAEVRAAGASIEYDDGLAGREPVPAPVGRTVYRIVQEGVTNARKHAPGAAIRISIAGSPEDGVQLVVRNRLGFGSTRTPGAELGLVGLTERAEMAGGRLAHGVEGDAFVLRAWLPWAP